MGTTAITTVATIPPTTVATTASTTAAVTTTSGIVACPTGINVCYNKGQCLVLNGRDFICACLPGFTGKLLVIK